MTCGHCELWIKPGPQYEPNSSGLCKYFEEWLDKHQNRNPTREKYDKAFSALGGKIWMRDIERNCSKFESNHDC